MPLGLKSSLRSGKVITNHLKSGLQYAYLTTGQSDCLNDGGSEELRSMAFPVQMCTWISPENRKFVTNEQQWKLTCAHAVYICAHAVYICAHDSSQLRFFFHSVVQFTDSINIQINLNFGLPQFGFVTVKQLTYRMYVTTASWDWRMFLKKSERVN
jgi:hypothetical protein